MATLIGDGHAADSSPFYSRAPSSTIASPPQHHPQKNQRPPLHQPPHPRQPPRPQDAPMPAAAAATATPSTATTTPRHPDSPPLSSSNSFSSPGHAARAAARRVDDSACAESASAATRIPTPPDSSSPSSPLDTRDRDGCEMASAATAASPAHSEAVITATSSASSSSSLPDFPASYIVPVPPPPHEAPETRPQRTILIRDLHHIQSLTQTDGALGGGSLGAHSLGNGLGSSSSGGGGGGGGFSFAGTPAQDVKFEISAMPIADIIEMVAALLTKITTTNDQQHDALHRNAAQQRQAQAHNESSPDHGPAGSGGGSGSGNGGSGSPFSASVLAFHGKNVPAITILSYLSRIHKYCPTTYEVFLSLLVYFDRMTERVNDLVMKQQQERERQQTAAAADVQMVDSEDAVVDETDEGLADSDDSDGDDEAMNGGEGGRERQPTRAAAGAAPPATAASDALSAATYFVVDSYNIHRLIIAGVTCASKFFSDVFYTNARYAKVGGLPLAELNHLELQFLILNDFRLAIPIEDLEAYATMLVEFYAREVIGARPRPSPSAARPAETAAAPAAAP